MKNILVSILIVAGVSGWGSVFACDGSDKDQAMSGTSIPVPATPSPAPTTSK